MSKLLLQAQKRDLVGKRQNKYRKNFVIPAVLYGFKIDNKNLLLKEGDFLKIYNQVGHNTIVDLQIEGENILPVLIKDIQYDPVSGRPIHVDLYQITPGKKIKTKIPIHLQGEAPAVKEKGGVLVKGINSLVVVTTPESLMPEIVVDLTSLDELGKSIRVKDLELPKDMRVLSNPFDTVARVVLSRGARKAMAAGYIDKAQPAEKEKK